MPKQAITAQAVAIMRGEGMLQARILPNHCIPSKALANWLPSDLRYYVVSTKRDLATFAPVHRPNSTEPNHLIADSGPHTAG